MKEIVLRIGDYILTAENPNDEPRIVDSEVAKRLGYRRDRDFRRMIRRLVEEGELPGIHMRATTARISKPKGGFEDRVVEEFHLTEREVIIATMAAKTPKAKRFRAQFAEVIVQARQQLRQHVETVDLRPEILNGPRICDSPRLVYELRATIEQFAIQFGWSIQRVHGWLRREWKTSSIYFMSRLFIAQLREDLEDLRCGRRSLPAPQPIVHRIVLPRPPDGRQISLFVTV
jgi:hypothetical protein